MKNLINSLSERVRAIRREPLPPQGTEGIQQIGHRKYVGGLWDEMGQLQFDFLVSNGLQPQHYLLDIACGSLRAGIHFIPYLDVGHYLGIEKEVDLIQAGIEKELGRALYEARKPQLVVSDSFEFEKFTAQPDYALAQSLFTHLPVSLIHDCFRKLRGVVQADAVFYATYFESDKSVSNPSTPHDHGSFAYTRAEMEAFGTQNGWAAEYVGNWNHPRGQVMVRYRPS